MFELSQVMHRAGAAPGFFRPKPLGVFLPQQPPPPPHAVQTRSRWVAPCELNDAGTHFYTQAEGDVKRAKSSYP